MYCFMSWGLRGAPWGRRACRTPKGEIDYALVDCLNYHDADRVYRKYGLEDTLTGDLFYRARQGPASR